MIKSKFTILSDILLSRVPEAKEYQATDFLKSEVADDFNVFDKNLKDEQEVEKILNLFRTFIK